MLSRNSFNEVNLKLNLKKRKNDNISTNITKKSHINPESIFISADLANIILLYIGIDEKTDLFNNRGNISFNTFFAKLELNRRPKIEKLLSHVIRGEQDLGERMISQYPEYLFSSGHVTDYSGRQFYRTALQCALATRDVSFREDIKECMVEMIIRYLKMHPEGEEAIKTQIKQQFPPSWEQKEIKENQKDMAAVEMIFQKIYHSKTSEECIVPIKEFRDYLNRKYLKNQYNHPIIRTEGFDFNYKMLEKAYELHEKIYYLLNKKWDHYKNQLIWDNVIGYLQRFLPACEGQIYAQGPDMVFHNVSFLRSLETSNRNWPWFSAYFPLLENTGLGFNIAEPRGPGQGMCDPGGKESARYCYSNLTSKKNIKMREIFSSVEPLSKNMHICKIM